MLYLAFEVFLALVLPLALCPFCGGLQVPVYTPRGRDQPLPLRVQHLQAHHIPGAAISPVYKTVGIMGRERKYCFKTITFKVTL